MSASLQDPDLQAHWDYFIGQTREKRAVRGHRSLTGDHPPRAFQIEGGNQYPHYPHYPQVLSWSHFSPAGIARVLRVLGQQYPHREIPCRRLFAAFAAIAAIASPVFSETRGFRTLPG